MNQNTINVFRCGNSGEIHYAAIHASRCEKTLVGFRLFESPSCRTSETSENNTTFPIPSSMVLMVIPHLVRLGPFGHVGRFLPVEAAQVSRRQPGGMLYARGLEVGQVLAADGQPARSIPTTTDSQRSSGSVAADGELLRKVTVEDDLLLWIERRKHEAFEACNKLLAERGIAAALMDVEHLFDGQSLYFYFLGSPPAEAELLTAELAAYDSAVEFRSSPTPWSLAAVRNAAPRKRQAAGRAGVRLAAVRAARLQRPALNTERHGPIGGGGPVMAPVGISGEIHFGTCKLLKNREVAGRLRILAAASRRLFHQVARDPIQLTRSPRDRLAKDLL